MLRWGLVPFWAKDPSIGNRMINARAETVAEKPSYRAAYRHRRCLVLADGFYEWQREGDTKTPYFISLADGEPFALAGLWENWTDKESGESPADDDADYDRCERIHDTPAPPYACDSRVGHSGEWLAGSTICSMTLRRSRQRCRPGRSIGA